MMVIREYGLEERFEGKSVFLCSEFCRSRFLSEPSRYVFADTGAATSAPDERRTIAYFSMEMALGHGMHSYAGGLGVLAGDMVKSCADLRVPLVGVTLLSRQGYFRQKLDRDGHQSELSAEWAPERFLSATKARSEVTIEGRRVRLRVWRGHVAGVTGYVVPVLFLDSDVAGNTEYDRTLTNTLYGGDARYRLAQECILGIGGVRSLRAVGYSGIERYHMNEGHASLLALELLAEQARTKENDWDFEAVRRQCVFTTHTPVDAGHDRFEHGLVSQVLGELVPDELLTMLGGKDALNMTLLGFNLSHYVNGVAKRHETTTRDMFPAHSVGHVTNGVHSWTWTGPEFQSLYDRHVPEWRQDSALLRNAIRFPGREIWDAHTGAKARLVDEVGERTGRSLRTDALTIGFARRATSYKRADLVFSDVARLRDISRQQGPLQFVFGGKAHPTDEPGKEVIRRIVRTARELGDELPVVYLEEYDLDLAKTLVAGVDLWLNTPERPKEASGTSGMKAAHNGVPSLSTLDGWWLEGHVEGLTGWSIGGTSTRGDADLGEEDAEDLYRKLTATIMPMFFQDRAGWIEVMRHAIALNASYFNSQRMVSQYVTSAYVGN